MKDIQNSGSDDNRQACDTANENGQSELELSECIKKIWKDVLEIEEVDEDSSFYELGGHSLKAVALEVRIKSELNVNISLEAIYKNLTLNSLTEYMKTLEKGSGTNIKPAGKREFYPASWPQKWVYIISRNKPEDISFNLSYAIVIEGDLDINRMEQSFKALVNRHEAFRTGFRMNGEEPVQIISDNVDFKLGYIECIGKNSDELIRKFIQPFNLEIPPLLRAFLIKTEEKKHILLIDIHHIIFDGYSMNILLKEISGIYNGKELSQINLKYADYSVYQNSLLGTEVQKERDNYWIEQFTGETPALNLPYDFPLSSDQSYAGEIYNLLFPKEQIGGLKELAGKMNITLHNLLFSIYILVLFKYTGQDDIVVGSVSAGRQYEGLENIIGMFINVLPIRSRLNKEYTFKEFITATNKTILDGYRNQEVSFERVLGELQPNKRFSVNTLFDTLFIYHSEIGAKNNMKLNELKTDEYGISKGDSSMDMQVDIFNNITSNSILLKIEYNKNLFRKNTIELFAKHFANAANEVINNPEIKLYEIDILSDEEKNRILCAFNNTETEYEKEKLFHQLLEEQAEKTPEAPAVVHNGKTITYSQLNKRSNQLARVLRDKGIGRNHVVGIMGDRSIETLVGVMAVLKAGGAYLPIDTNYPKDRIEYIIKDSKITVLLVSKLLYDDVEFKGEIIDINNESLYKGEYTDLPHINTSQDLVYVIYTSGTTGKPKGVMVEHHGLMNVAYAWRREYNLDKFNVSLLQIASFSFDVFAGDMARAFMNGGQMVLCTQEILFDFPRLYKLMREYSINILESTPSLMIPFMDYVYDNNLVIDNMKLLIVGSDICPIEEFAKLKERYGHIMRIINSYGVTEVSITSSYYEEELDKMPAAGNTPIGKPLQNTRFYVLDDYLKLQPVGIVGELYISGDGVARGYINRPDLTSERYMPDPFKKGLRMYRTGDIARWLPDGNLDFLGRIDQQVKIRGYRIELSEIEACILKNEKIRDAVVIAREDEKKDRFLASFVVSEEAFSDSTLKESVAKYLPYYMVPSYFIPIDKIPLTPNGKIDKRLLAKYELQQNTVTEYSSPTNEIEGKLVMIWNEVLGKDRIGINDDFFEKGGHSLKLINMIGKVRDNFGIGIPLNDFLKVPTIKNMAEYISSIEDIGNIVSVK